MVIETRYFVKSWLGLGSPCRSMAYPHENHFLAYLGAGNLPAQSTHAASLFLGQYLRTVS